MSSPTAPSRSRAADGAVRAPLRAAAPEVEIKGLVEARFGLALDYAVWSSPAEMIRSLYEDQRPD